MSAYEEWKQAMDQKSVSPRISQLTANLKQGQKGVNFEAEPEAAHKPTAQELFADRSAQIQGQFLMSKGEAVPRKLQGFDGIDLVFCSRQQVRELAGLQIVEHVLPPDDREIEKCFNRNKDGQPSA